MKKIVLFLLFISTSIIFSQSVLVNEVVSSNTGSFYDEYGSAPDWIELYNTSDTPINLNGFYLSDDTSKVTKWQFGEAIIEAKDYLIVCASDKDTANVYWHTNFKISGSGEYVVLSDSTGKLIDSIYVPASIDDYSFGRKIDGSSEWIYQVPTPGESNMGNIIKEFADEINFSKEGGFYTSSVDVELSAGDSEIYYTLDGSNPDSASKKYSSPIQVTKTTVVKAFSKKDGYLDTDIIHHTYFIDENTKLPVISISTDPDNFFGSDSGIFVHFEEDWERPAHIEFYDDDKQLGFSENVGVNVHGGYTQRFAQKSLGVKFKSKYGNNKLDYDLFPGFWLKTFKAFILRNSGNDFDQTHIRDAFMQTLIKDLDIDYQEYRPAIAYINGEFWGIYNIREKLNEHYVANRHGVDPDNIDMMEGYSAYNDDIHDLNGEYGLWVGNLEAVHGDTIKYKELIDYLKNEDLTTDEAYTYLDKEIDLQECILYYAAQVYYNNQDWPANNSKYWRERSPEGKWRWMIYDLDFGFNLYEYNNEGNREDHVNYLFSGDPSQRPESKPVESTFIPRKLVENPKIKKMFVNQVADLLNTNFQKDRVLDIMHEIADHIADDIDRHRNRFDIWGSDLSRLESFATNRPGNVRNHVRNFFNTGDDCKITIKSDGGGKILLNTLSIEQDQLPWSGLYYQNNEITVSAVPNEGYKFVGWNGSINSADNLLKISGLRNIELTANFVIDSSSVNDIVINEINYNSADDFDAGDWIELYNRSENVVDLSNWYFSDSDTSHKFVIPDGTTLESGSYLVLVQNDSLFSTAFPEVVNYLGEIGFGLSGSGELIRLFNPSNEIIDSLTYSDDDPWPTTADGDGPTLELINTDADNSIAEFWSASKNHGTPGAKNSVITDIKENNNSVVPTEYALSQNYPNPFNPTTKINYKLPLNTNVQLKVYDLLGREVMTVVNTAQSAGSYSVEINANQLASGMYIYTLQTDSFVQSKKMVLLK